MKIAALLTVSTFLSLSAPGLLRAQEPSLVLPQADADSGADALLPPGTPALLAPPTTPDEAGSMEQSIYGPDDALNDAPAEPTAQGRPWKFNLHALIGSRYDNNIFISRSGRKPDFISTVSAGGGITLGDYTARQNNYLITDYTGSGEIFARHSDQDAYEQEASLEGQILMAHLTLHTELGLQDLSDTNIDIGTRAQSQTYTGLEKARYDISDKTFLEATAQFAITHYDSYIGSNDERGGLSFNFRPNPDVTVGIQALAGVLGVDNSSSQTYEQLLATFQAAATGKFSLTASAGVEDRQTPDKSNLFSPVLSLTGDYKPFENLDLTLTGFSQVVNSAYYVGSDYISTGIAAEVAYQLSARFAVSLGAGYTNNDYRDTGTATIARNDNYFFVRPAFRYTASTYCYVEVYYCYRDDASSVSTSSFNDTQIGVSFNLTY